MTGSTPALVNPTLAVVPPAGGGGTAVPAMALERELTGPDGKRIRTPPKVSSRSVHGNYTIYIIAALLRGPHIGRITRLARPSVCHVQAP